MPTHYLKLRSLSFISAQLEKSAYMKEVNERKIAQLIHVTNRSRSKDDVREQ